MKTTATQTFLSFHDKWHNNPDLAFAMTQREGSDIYDWILTRNGFANTAQARDYLSSKRRVLDAGCGNGRVSALLNTLSGNSTQIVAVDLTAADVARNNLQGYPRITVEQGDLLGDLSRLGKFDFIYCQEVLHHTKDPRGGFNNLVTLLEPGGELAIYVYKVKAPAREFLDDHVRAAISGLDYPAAMSSMEQITLLGKMLSEAVGQVTVPAVDVLGIEAGTYDLQRFVYHFFCKCFWNPELSFDANVAINYDWYHPQLCTRHTVAEVQEWFQLAGLAVNHVHVDPYGITMRGRRV